MSRSQNLDSFTPTPQSAIMEEAEYPSTPTKPRKNQTSQSYMGSFLGTPQSDANSTQSATPSSAGVEEHLRNNSLKARIEQLTAACDDLNAQKTQSEKEFKDLILKIFSAYASVQGLNSDDLTIESAQEIWNAISFEAEASIYLRTHSTDLDAQTEALRKDLVASRSQCQSLEERLFDQDAEIQNLLQTLEFSQEEAGGLRAQVQALQKQMLAQVSNNEVITDEVFSRDFHALALLVKSLSRSVQPAQNIDIFDALKPCMLLCDVSKHHWDTRARRKAYVEAWIWSVLVATIFQYSFGFCGDLIVFHKNWRFVFGKNWTSDWPQPSPESETWRFTTIAKLVEEVGRETLIGQQNHGNRSGLTANARHLQKAVLERRAQVTNVIKSSIKAVAPTSDLPHVSDIIDKAFTLALDMSLQRFRVQVTWPDIGAKFEASQMTPVPDRNGEGIRGGVVAFIVNPGLTRWGTIHGQNFNVCHEIVPSLVQLEPVQTMRKASHVLVPVKREPEGIQ